jgi:hypothetical protein
MIPTQDPLSPYILNNVNPLISNITKLKFLLVVDTSNFDAITKERFIVDKKSPLIDAGYTYPYSNVKYDIMGNNRVFGNDIDIGPFETIVNSKFLLINDIEDIFQSKIIKYSSIYSIYDKGIILRDFYSEMTQGQIDEYIKSYKIFIKIKSVNKIELHSDKKDIPIDEYDALYDSGENMLIVTKNSNYSADVFSNFFDKDQYILYYDDTSKKLYVYYKYTSTVAVFGKTAPLNVIKR